MPFHVEISGGLNHARAFNLSAKELRQQVLEPWLAQRPVELGEHEWEPQESDLRILEGPHLDPPELSFGQGWSNAERSAEDVTVRQLAEAEPVKLPDAFVVRAELPEATVGEMLSGQQAEPVSLNEVRKRLDGRDPEIAAIVLVTRQQP